MSRLVPAAALAVLLAAGCGSSGRPHTAAGSALPHELAREWASRASAIADAAAAGQSCRASRLAASLRDEIVSAEGKVPVRLRVPLVTGANALADRLTCTTPPQTVTLQHPPKRPEPHKHHKPPPKHHEQPKENH